MGDASSAAERVILDKVQVAGRIATLGELINSVGLEVAKAPGSVALIVDGAALAAEELAAAGDPLANVAQELTLPASQKSTNKPRG